MYKQLLSKIRKTEKIDFRGTFFYTLYLIRNKYNIYLFNWIIKLLCIIKGVKLGKNVIFNGKPYIIRHPNSTICFGDNCKFNSAKFSIATGPIQPCTFVTVGEHAEIVFGTNSGATGLKIQARSKIVVGKNVLIGYGCTILDNDAHHSDPIKRQNNLIPSRPISIQDNVFIGLHCTILKGVIIGENSVIGANSVVFNSIPENSIAVGNPCKVIMKRNLE